MNLFQLFARGGEQYTNATRDKRQVDIKFNSYFTCTCIACKEDWQKFTRETMHDVIINWF